MKYKNIIIVHSKLTRHHPVSLVYLKQNDDNLSSIGFITIENEYYPLLQVIYRDTKDYCYLFTINNDSNLDNNIYYNLDINNIQDFLVAVPYQRNLEKIIDRNLYYIISRSGKELNPKKELIFPYL